MRMRTRAEPIPDLPAPPLECAVDERQTAIPASQPRDGTRDPARGRARRDLPRPRKRRHPGSRRQGPAAGAVAVAPALGRREPALLPVVPADGPARPQRLPDLRQADGPAAPDELSAPAMTRL